MCLQCQKANRECILASGVTFRHHQNPSLNGQRLGESSLKSFYGYKETFGTHAVWVDIPQDLTFVHTINPYDDDEEPQYSKCDDDSSFATGDTLRNHAHTDMSNYDLAQATYPAYATHGLEALSTIASQDQPVLAPPPASIARRSRSKRPMTTAESPRSAIPTGQSRDRALDLPPANIDPRLHQPAPPAAAGFSLRQQSPSERVCILASSDSLEIVPCLQPRVPKDILPPPIEELLRAELQKQS